MDLSSKVLRPRRVTDIRRPQVNNRPPAPGGRHRRRGNPPRRRRRRCLLRPVRLARRVARCQAVGFDRPSSAGHRCPAKPVSHRNHPVPNSPAISNSRRHQPHRGNTASLRPFRAIRRQVTSRQWAANLWQAVSLRWAPQHRFRRRVAALDLRQVHPGARRLNLPPHRVRRLNPRNRKDRPRNRKGRPRQRQAASRLGKRKGKHRSRLNRRVPIGRRTSRFHHQSSSLLRPLPNHRNNLRHPTRRLHAPVYRRAGRKRSRARRQRMARWRSSRQRRRPPARCGRRDRLTRPDRDLVWSRGRKRRLPASPRASRHRRLRPPLCRKPPSRPNVLSPNGQRRRSMPRRSRSGPSRCRLRPRLAQNPSGRNSSPGRILKNLRWKPVFRCGHRRRSTRRDASSCTSKIGFWP